MLLVVASHLSTQQLVLKQLSQSSPLLGVKMQHVLQSLLDLCAELTTYTLLYLQSLKRKGGSFEQLHRLQCFQFMRSQQHLNQYRSQGPDDHRIELIFIVYAFIEAFGCLISGVPQILNGDSIGMFIVVIIDQRRQFPYFIT